MLFMVIEQFHSGAVGAIRERFSTHGRLLPPDVTYTASWVEPERLRCFQLMEAPDREHLLAWATRWADLVDFEIVPVQSSEEFWRSRPT